MKELSLYIIDDHPLLRKALISVLEDYMTAYKLNFKEFGTIESAYQEYLNETHLPDIVFLDLELTDGSGFSFISKVNQNGGSQKIVMLSVHNDFSIVKHAYDLGVSGYLSKEIALDEIGECLDVVLLGDKYYPDDFEIFDSRNKIITELDKLVLLTKAEKRVLKMVSEKISSKEISEKMFINPKSVDNYRTRISKKLNLEYRNASLLIWCLENKKKIDLME